MEYGTSHLQTVQENILSHIIIATYRKFTVASVRFTQNVSCNIYIHPRYQQMSVCNNWSDNKSYWIHRVDVKVSAQVTTVTYMHQSQPSSHSLRINLTVHLELWPGNHLIFGNVTLTALCWTLSRMSDRCIFISYIELLERRRMEGNILFNNTLNTFYLRQRQFIKTWLPSEIMFVDSFEIFFVKASRHLKGR